MWMIVRFLVDDSIKYVPETWYNNKKKMCAWPIAKNYSKKLIDKMTPLHLFEHDWLPAKKIGQLHESLKEIRSKMYYARILANISVKQENESTEVTRKILENKTIPISPTVKPRCKEEARNDMYYANVLLNLSKKSENMNVNVTEKTLEKKLIKDEPTVKSSIPKKAQQIKNENNSKSTTTSVKDNELSNNCDFQNQVLSLLKKIDFEISNLKTTSKIQHDAINRFDTYLKNTVEETIGSPMFDEYFIALDNTFPLKSEEKLKIFEEKIRDNKIFRNNVRSRLSVLNNINNIGISVKGMMAKMFSDKLISQYSLLGTKKRKNFSSLSTYRLLIDTIQPKHSKSNMEQINAQLAIYLTKAKFRVENRKNRFETGI